MTQATDRAANHILDRVDGRPKVMGAAPYTSEQRIPNLAYGVLVQSTKLQTVKAAEITRCVFIWWCSDNTNGTLLKRCGTTSSPTGFLRCATTTRGR